MTAEQVRPESFSTLFSQALQGHPCHVVGVDEAPVELPVADWVRDADESDAALLGHCRGPTIDIGCGPGRLSARLTELGHVVLGIDVVHEAVRQTRARGASAIVRDVFETLPGEGRWHTALLADGNVGIGGDPATLLSRVRQLLGQGGRAVVEVAPPGTGVRSVWASLRCGATSSRPFRWSVVGAEAIEEVAVAAGFAVATTYAVGHRWCAVLELA